MNRSDFEHAHPGVFFLDPAEPDRLAEVLLRLGVLGAGETIRAIERAGPGNMNCVLRVTTSSASWIVKQARPWVEKYPQFAAPWDRALREREFYQLVASAPEVAAGMPRVGQFDAAARLLILEDLGPGSDFTGIYAPGTPALDFGTVDFLADYLSALHRLFSAASPPFEFANRAMRDLNAAHIFFLPLQPGNGLDLDTLQPGLAAAAAPLLADRSLAETVGRLGRETYLADGPCLIHGDFFPGSLLHTPAGPRVIDPEFGFFGRAEFDVAVFVAHLTLAGQPTAVRDRFLARYRRRPDWKEPLLWQLAGIEIIRRLIGYAQLPLVRPVDVKRRLLAQAHAWILDPETSPR